MLPTYRAFSAFAQVRFITLFKSRSAINITSITLRLHELNRRDVHLKLLPSTTSMSTNLDLASLRREREARQALKRERSISPPASRKAPKLETSDVTLPSGALLRSYTSTVKHDVASKVPDIDNSSIQAVSQNGTSNRTSASSNPISTSPVLQYPHGIVKKTWAFGHDRNEPDVKIEEVLERHTVHTAVLSAYQWDFDWLLSKLNVGPDQTKCVFVMQGKEASERARYREMFSELGACVRLCFPPMEGQTNCMHSKLMLLFHPHKLRVAIPSANLRNFDWGEDGVMENSVFMVDLPRWPDGSSCKKETLSDFGKELLFFMDKQGFDQMIKDGILNFDFSATERMAFVHSIGGISAGDDAQRSGLASLSRAVRQLGLQNDDVEIDFAASSIGSLKDNQLVLLHAAACGKDVFQFTATSASKQAAGFFQKGNRPDRSIRDKIRIYFPTQQTVRASKAGAAGTICLSRQWFEDMAFPRRCFRNYVSTRSGLLSHNKLMYVRPLSTSNLTAYVYVGSANMSESAWGKLVEKKKEKSWHVNCRNWECGVLLPVSIPTTSSEGKASAQPGLHVFDNIAKLPFVHPGAEYGEQEPWYHREWNGS